MTQPKTASKFTPGPWLSSAEHGCGCSFEFGETEPGYGPYRRILFCPKHAAAPEMYELLEAAINICDFMDAGVLVRSTKNDAGPDWAMRQIPLVKAIKGISEARQIKTAIDGEG